MIRWTYKQSEPRLWTTGFTDPAGKWHPDGDHGSPVDARERAAWLNGTAGNGEDDLVHVYWRTEPGLWTTGHYDRSGRWWPVSDHDDEQAAAAACAELNGSRAPQPDKPVTGPLRMGHLYGETYNQNPYYYTVDGLGDVETDA